MVALSTAAVLVLRGGHAAWLAQEGDLAQLASAQATLRHVVRSIRQATSVVSLSTSTPSGALSLLLPSGQTVAYGHDSGAQQAKYGVTTADGLLADGIAEFYFTAYKADGVTSTTTPADVQLIRCTVRVDLPRDTGGTRTLSCLAWLRSW